MIIRREEDVHVWSLQQRFDRPKPHITRWAVDGRQFSRGFRTKAQADRLRSKLLIAQQQGQPFSHHTGEPESWSPSPADQSVLAWARRWVADEWTDWSPRTRDSEIEALARFVPLAVASGATEPPAGIRRHLNATLRPQPPVVDQTAPVDALAKERWLERWVLTLGQLDESVLSDVDRELGLKLDGQAAAPNTAARYRRTAKACIRRAVELKQISTDPWPPTPLGRSRRKARRRREAIDVKRLPDPATMLRLLDAMVSHQPASRTYRAMTAVAYYSGLRPSEVIMLRPRSLVLSGNGWGLIDVTETDDGYDDPADPKTGPRPVPIPPQLVHCLAEWLRVLDPPNEHALLFRTRTGRRPALSNWGRSLRRAAELVGHDVISPYDCRHTCATTWLRAGVPLGEAALRLGHSVETLVAHYVGALQGDDLVANERISRALDEAEA